MCLVTPRTRHLSAMHATATEGANSLRWLCTPTSTACKLAATRVISSSALWWHRMNNNFWTHSSLGRLSSVRAGGWGSRANWGDLGSSTAAYLPPAGERAHRVDGRRQLQHRDCWVGWYRQILEMFDGDRTGLVIAMLCHHLPVRSTGQTQCPHHATCR